MLVKGLDLSNILSAYEVNPVIYDKVITAIQNINAN